MNARGEKRRKKRFAEKEKRLKRSVDMNGRKITVGGKKSCISSNSGIAVSRNMLTG
jgi:hypothetical protein